MSSRNVTGRHMKRERGEALKLDTWDLTKLAEFLTFKELRKTFVNQGCSILSSFVLKLGRRFLLAQNLTTFASTS